jgi:RNA recognition motif-containing protein
MGDSHQKLNAGRPSTIDMALDEVIRDNRSQKRQPRRSSNPPRTRHTPIQRRVFTVRNDRFGKRSPPLRDEGKLVVSNLFHQVTKEDLAELFAQVGPVKNVWVNYDRAGRSNGSAEITFYNQRDAMLAHDRFHHMPLDGYPMQIEINRQRQEMPEERPNQRHERSHQRQNRARSFGVNKSRSNRPNASSLDAELDSYMMRDA